MGLFVLALLAARLIVVWKSAVVLTEPINLTHAGISVRMPHGNGWDSTGRWEYRESYLMLGSTFAPGLSRPTGAARCRYIFAPETISVEEQFERKRSEIEGEIVKKGRISSGAVAVDWIHIQKADAAFNLFFGTAKLPYNRRLEIEVRRSIDDADSAGRVFQSIAESLELTESPLLDAGRRIISEMKTKGIADFLGNESHNGLFLIKDARREILGFTTDVLVDTGPPGEPNIQGASLFYIRGRFASEQVSSFQCDNRFDQFVWKSEIIDSKRRGTIISVDDEGMLTVAELGDQPRRKSYYTSEAAIPEKLLDQLLVHILGGRTRELIVDIIGVDGRITPTYITSTDPEDIRTQDGISYLVKLMPMDNRGFLQRIFLDDRMQIVKYVIREEDIFVLDIIDPESAARLFGERAAYILQDDKLRQYLNDRE